MPFLPPNQQRQSTEGTPDQKKRNYSLQSVSAVYTPMDRATLPHPTQSTIVLYTEMDASVTDGRQSSVDVESTWPVGRASWPSPPSSLGVLNTQTDRCGQQSSTVGSTACSLNLTTLGVPWQHFAKSEEVWAKMDHVSSATPPLGVICHPYRTGYTINFCAKLAIFTRTATRKCTELVVRDHSRSSAVSPFDIAHTISYSTFIYRNYASTLSHQPMPVLHAVACYCESRRAGGGQLPLDFNWPAVQHINVRKKCLDKQK